MVRLGLTPIVMVQSIRLGEKMFGGFSLGLIFQRLIGQQIIDF